MKVLKLRSCMVLASMLSGGAYAQEAGVVPAQASGAQSASPFDDIVVTARKREENLRDVPISITALGAQSLVEAKITQIVDLGQRIPNFSVSAGANLPFSLIRGFGSGNNISFDQAVGKFVDNVSYGRDQDIRLPIFDVERVEVLKGPQVLLYGNSATAGVLNITTRKPGPDLSADASVGYEFNHREVVAQAGITLPVAEGVGLRVAGLYNYRGKGHVYNILTGVDEPQARNWAVRGIFRAEATPALTVTLKAEYARLRETGTSAELMSQPVFAPLVFDDVALDSRTAVDNRGAPFFQDNVLGVNNETYQGDIQYDVGGGTITSTTAYRQLTSAQSLAGTAPIPLLNAFLAYRYRQFSQELRYGGTFGDLDITVGGYYQKDHFEVWSAIDFNLAPTLPPGALPPGFVLPPFAVNGALDQEQRSYSMFADATYRLWDTLSLSLGGRYSWVEKDADQSLVPGDLVPRKGVDTRADALSPNPALTPFFVLGTGVAPHSFTGLEYRDQFFQPQAVLQYEVAPRNKAFLKYVRGEKAGGFDYFYTGVPPLGAVPEGAQFAAERAESFEAGIKGLIFGGQIDYSLVAFRTTFTDLQASSFQTAAFVVTNVGKARTQGIELELNYAPVTGLRLGLAGAYLDAKYLDYPGQPCTVAQAVAFGSPNGCAQDLSGAPTQFASRWTGNFTADYEFPVAPDLKLAAGIAVFARSKYNASTNNEPLHIQPGFAKIDAHLALKEEGGRWTLSVFGKNLTDKQTLEFGAKAPAAGEALSGFRSRGREIGLRMGFSY